MVNFEQTHPSHHYNQSAALAAVGGSVTEGIAGIGAAVLAILGLIGVFPALFLYIATIAIGVALFSNGVGIASRISYFLSETENESTFENINLGSGISAETLGGAAGIVLGILALVGISSLLLVGIASIVFGIALLMSSRSSLRLNSFAIPSTANESSRGIAREMIAMSADTQIFAGIGAVTLGILALIGVAPLTLSLVVMLGIGIVNFLSGQSMSIKFSRSVKRS